MQAGAKAYFETKVQTADPGHLVVLLYEGAIKYLTQAKVKIEEKDYAQKGILISKALDIIAELDHSLNAEKGGELAANLHQLYFFCNTRLLRANMDMDCTVVDEVIKVLDGLRDAFHTITAQAVSGEASAEQKPSLGRGLFAKASIAKALPVQEKTATSTGNDHNAYGPAKKSAATEQAAQAATPVQPAATQVTQTQPVMTAQQAAGARADSPSAPAQQQTAPQRTPRQGKSVVAAAYASHSLSSAAAEANALSKKHTPQKTSKSLFSPAEKKPDPKQTAQTATAATYAPPGAQR